MFPNQPLHLPTHPPIYYLFMYHLPVFSDLWNRSLFSYLILPLFLLIRYHTHKPFHQISAKRAPDSRFVVEGNIEALVSKLNTRRSEYVMVRGWSIQPQNEYCIAFGPKIKQYSAILELLSKYLFVLFVFYASKLNNYSTMNQKWWKIDKAENFRLIVIPGRSIPRSLHSIVDLNSNYSLFPRWSHNFL